MVLNISDKQAQLDELHGGCDAKRGRAEQGHKCRMRQAALACLEMPLSRA